jgi:hypothetical protein
MVGKLRGMMQAPKPLRGYAIGTGRLYREHHLVSREFGALFADPLDGGAPFGEFMDRFAGDYKMWVRLPPLGHGDGYREGLQVLLHHARMVLGHPNKVAGIVLEAGPTGGHPPAEAAYNLERVVAGKLLPMSQRIGAGLCLLNVHDPAQPPHIGLGQLLSIKDRNKAVGIMLGLHAAECAGHNLWGTFRRMGTLGGMAGRIGAVLVSGTGPQGREVQFAGGEDVRKKHEYMEFLRYFRKKGIMFKGGLHEAALMKGEIDGR